MIFSKKKTLFIGTLVLAASLIASGCASETTAGGNQAKGGPQDIYEGFQLDAKFRKVNVSTDVISVRIEPSSDTAAHFQLKSDAPDEIDKRFDVSVQATDDRLDVKLKGKNNFKLADIMSWNEPFKAELLIQLPQRDYDKIKLDSDVGKIDYSRINADQLEADNDVGEISVADAQTKQLKINNSVGVVKVSQVTGAMDVKNSTGSIQVKVKDVQDNIHAKTNIGAVTIDIEQEPVNVKLDLSTDLGSMKHNLDVEYDTKTRGKIVAHKGSNGPEIKVGTDIGEIDVRILK